MIDYIVALGFVAGTLTTLSYIPQVIDLLRTRESKDISLGMYITVSAGLLLWTVYGVYIGSLPLMVMSTISLALALSILAIKLKCG